MTEQKSGHCVWDRKTIEIAIGKLTCHWSDHHHHHHRDDLGGHRNGRGHGDCRAPVHEPAQQQLCLENEQNNWINVGHKKFGTFKQFTSRQAALFHSVHRRHHQRRGNPRIPRIPNNSTYSFSLAAINACMSQQISFVKNGHGIFRLLFIFICRLSKRSVNR